MADGLLAGGGLGSQTMTPQPERTGWAVEEEPEPLEKGEHPSCRARGASRLLTADHVRGGLGRRDLRGRLGLNRPSGPGGPGWRR